MSPLELLALSRAVEEKEEKLVRGQVSPGKYPVDFTAHVHGIITVGEDGEVAQTAKALSLEAVATALYFAGATRERAIQSLTRVALGEKTEADAKRDVFVAQIIADLRERFAQLPKKKRNGPVSAAVIVESK